MIKPIFLTSGLVGFILGLISTYPFSLGPIASLSLWALGGILLGAYFDSKKEILWSGGLYGFFLSISFLYSRFGGTAYKIFGYSILVLFLSMIGMVGGVLSVFIGIKLKKIMQRYYKK